MDPAESNLITVTTPTGTTTQKDGAKGIAGAVRQGAAAAAANKEQQAAGAGQAASSGMPSSSASSAAPKLPSGSLAPLQQQAAHVNTAPGIAPATPGAAAGAGVLSGNSLLSGQSAAHSAKQRMDQQQQQQQAETGGAAPGLAPGSSPPDGNRPPLEFNHAINYVNKIKQRFSNDPETYKQFLEILQTYQKEGRAIQDVYAQVTVLFEGAKDLLDEFKQFLPDTSAQAAQAQQPNRAQPQQIPAAGAKAGAQASTTSQRGKKRAQPGGEVAVAAPKGPGGAQGGRSKKAKHGHKQSQQQQQQPPPQMPHHQVGLASPPQSMMHPADHAAAYGGMPPGVGQQIGAMYNGMDGMVPADTAAAAAAAAAGLVPSNVVSAGIPLGPAYAPLATLDEVAFFDRVKKHIDDRAAYLEFLKLLNLYTQDTIDVRTLVDKAAAFIGGHRDLFATFKSLCGYEMGRHGWLEEEEAIIENTPALERPRIDLNTCEQFGASYRRLPKDEVNLACSGRDAMCWEVLNDEWVSHPTWASEGEGFNPHKKNIYEDALYRSEEERHEYDYHIEANLRTIALLEPIAARIAAMDEQERANFRLKPGLGGQSRSIYQRVLRKIYGRDAGAEIVAALHDSPSTSVPVVLARLRQKDEEWKRAQREWNKVWRVVDERNWWKSLDHRGVSWKTFDKKAITVRGLVGEIELRRAEDIGRRWMRELGGPRSILGTESGASSKATATPASKGNTSATTIDGNLASPKEGPWHLAFDFSDRSLVFDVIKLALSHLDRASSYSRSDIDRIEMFVRSFLPLLVGEDAKDWEDDMGLGPVTSDDDEDDEGSVADGASKEASPARGAAERRRKDEDLRMRVLRGQAVASSSTSLANATDSQANDGDSDMNGTSTKSNMEQTWIRADTRDAFDSKTGSSSSTPAGAATSGRTTSYSPVLNFFCSTSHYAFLRLFQLAYIRLGKLKRLSAEMGREVDDKNRVRKGRGQKTSVMRGNPVALRLGLQDRWGGVGSVVGSSATSAATGEDPSATQTNINGSAQPQLPSAPVSGWELHPAKYYTVLLDLIEKLFDGDSIDQNMFEESVRFMFGIEGYVVFTIDKVLGGLVKMAQSIINDNKCTELQTLLDQDRRRISKEAATATSTDAPSARAQQAAAYRHRIAMRMSAECLVGKEEHLFRVGWNPSSHKLGIQMLSRDDPSADLPPYLADGAVGVAEGTDEKLKEEQWLYYISSYALWAPTEGLMGEAKAPFLKRNVHVSGPQSSGSGSPANREASAPVNGALDAGAGQSSSSIVSPAGGESGSNGTKLPSETKAVRYVTETGLEIKVCLSTYRLFFVSDTEDTFARVTLHGEKAPGQEEGLAEEARKARVSKRRTLKHKTFGRWLEGRRKEIDEEPAQDENVQKEQPQEQPQEPEQKQEEEVKAAENIDAAAAKQGDEEMQQAKEPEAEEDGAAEGNQDALMKEGEAAKDAAPNETEGAAQVAADKEVAASNEGAGEASAAAGAGAARAAEETVAPAPSEAPAEAASAEANPEASSQAPAS